MKIRFCRYDRGDIDDPKTGSPMNVTSESLYALLSGRVVSGVGGVSAGTESVVLNFSDGTALWFVTTQGVPRLLYQKYPLKP